MTLNLDLNIKHTGATAVVIFTSNLNEAADNVIFLILRNRNLGPSEILFYL